MKTKYINSVIALCSIFFFACQSSEENFENKAYINASSMRNEVIVKGSTNTITKTFNVYLAKPEAKPIDVFITVEPSLVATYNKKYGEQAQMLPDSCFTLAEATVQIPVGSIKSEDIHLSFSKLDSVRNDKVFVLPVHINTNNIALLESQNTFYYVFKAGALINVVADIEKNFLSVSWKNPGVVSSLSQLTMEALIRARDFDRKISTVMGVEGYFLIRIGDAGFPANQIQIATSRGNFPDADSNKGLPTNKWVHVALTYDSTTGEMVIYVNGKEQSRGTKNVGKVNLASGGSNPFFIGYSYAADRWLGGEISECRIWNKVRTQEEIAQNIYSVSPKSEGLVSYWKFDEENSLLVKDVTGNGNDATANKPLKWTSVSLPER